MNTVAKLIKASLPWFAIVCLVGSTVTNNEMREIRLMLMSFMTYVFHWRWEDTGTFMGLTIEDEVAPEARSEA